MRLRKHKRSCAYHGGDSEAGDVVPLQFNLVLLSSFSNLPGQLALGVAAGSTDSVLGFCNELQRQ